MVTTLVINEKVAKLQFPSAQFPHHPDDDDGPCNDLPQLLSRRYFLFFLHFILGMVGGWDKTIDWGYSSTGYLWMHLRLKVSPKKATYFFYSVFNIFFTAKERESYW